VEWKSVRTVTPERRKHQNTIEYNALLKNDPRVETVLLPIRDGLTVSRVIAYAFFSPDGNENPAVLKN
jgi:predicted O-methyltransferase YrrM